MEAGVGLWAGSLALVADAGHMVNDAVADPVQTEFRDALAALVKQGVPVHVCQQAVEAIGQAAAMTALGLGLEYARDAFISACWARPFWKRDAAEDGASEIGFIAASIATWYYRTGLWTVLAWTIGASLVTGLGLALMLKGKVE